MHHNIQLAQLQTSLEKTQSRAAYWDNKWTRIQDTAAKKTLQLGRIKMSTHNLVGVINRHENKTATATTAGGLDVAETTERQLERIETFITDLANIINEIKSSSSA